MRGPRLSLLTALASTALVAACLGTTGVETARGDAAQVTVVAPGGAARTLALDALAGQEDVVERSYALRASGEGSARIVTGFSLAAIVEAAGIDSYGFSYLEAQRPAGGSVVLSREQALDHGGGAEGPAVVYATTAGTGFLRPSAGPGDLNGSDCFEAPHGVTLVLRKGPALRVRAEASPRRTRPGRQVAFTAIVDRAGSGEPLSYSWYFDDGHSAVGASARHSFAKRGSYDVVVGVTAPGDEVGASAVVTVQVGPPLAGPDRKGGGRDRDANAPDHGAASGANARGPGGPHGAGSDAPAGSREGERSATAADGGEKRTIPAPSPPTVPSPPADRPEPRRAPPPAAGERVSGRLLASAAAPASEPASTPAARAGVLSEDGGGAGLSDAALGLLAILGLLGFGAAIETRSLLP